MAATTTRAGIGLVRWRDAAADAVQTPGARRLTDEQFGVLADEAVGAVR
jgi:hypothetical protein